jgi:hypothetical protein
MSGSSLHPLSISLPLPAGVVVSGVVVVNVVVIDYALRAAG